ncbi:MAG TPA: beta-ketoacyl synthase N-terminal-like domain-containing protein, partial [Streptosporangiaceae bacterium]|nr:beta-ketoacyl synthase N-terminal-like domain-containing protein [Streptosporangiaceae bacterium]
MSTPIAIVGVGAIYPGAGNAADFWGNIRAGVDAISEVPAHRWDPGLYYDPSSYESPRSDRFYCRRGGFVDGLATFDPVAFGIMPSAVAGIEPDQLLALRTAADAIADAGGEARLPDRARIGVIIGRGGYLTPGVSRFDQLVRTSHQLVGALRDLVPDLGEERLELVRQAFRDRLGPDGADDSIGLVPSFAAARIANRFDLRGPAHTIDAACASSLVAVEQAMRMLRDGQCDAMLAGAVHHAHHVTVWSVFNRLRVLSRSQRIRPFSSDADGTLLSEGTGVVVLKRLGDAQRAGDRIYAVIRGAGSSSDGRAGGLMSPVTAGQVLAVERAWQDAGLDPRAPGAVGLIEAHGTGTPAGDGVELDTLLQVFGTAGTPIGLGTVKSMIGHAMPAGGMAGLIKAALALHDAVLPPTLHAAAPHPALTGTRFTLLTDALDWEPAEGTPRRAAVNAFGFGGANAHLLLEEDPTPLTRGVSRTRRPLRCGKRLPLLDESTERVLRLRAGSVGELGGMLGAPDEELIGQADGVLGFPGGPELPGGCRLAIVDPTPRRLELARTIVERGSAWRGRSGIWFSPVPLLTAGGRIAFLFPGFEPVFEPRIDDVAAYFGLGLPELTGRTDLIGHATDVISVGRLLAGALRELGVEPDVAAGHSLGEWTAMNVFGMYEQDAADVFLAALDHTELKVPDVAYAALGCGAERAGAVVADLDGLVVSHDNCPHQSVICGPPAQVRRALDRLWSEGVLGQELPFRSGFHTPMAEAYLGPVHRSFAALSIGRSEVPLWSATTVAPFPEDPDEVRALVVRHLLEPVRFSALVRALHDSGVRAFIQVGPGSLTGFVGDSLSDSPAEREFLAMAVNVPKRDGIAQLRRVAAALWTEGYIPPAAAEEAPPQRDGVTLDLGSALVRLDGVLPAVAQVPPLAEGVPAPLLAEFDALLHDATATAQAVLGALGRRSVTERVFSLETMDHVGDHCLIPQREGWPEPSDRFPVVPLTTLLEVMAETARELLPDLVVTGVQNVRALRWVVADPPTTVTIRASHDGPGRVKVVIDGHADGTVLLADRYPAAPAPDRTPLSGERPPPVTAERLYSERWMFHGPRYQGVSEIGALAKDGLRGTLTSLPAPGALLDSAGQLLGHWIQVREETARTVFPTGIERVEWYGPPPPHGERLPITCRNRFLSDTTMRGDGEVLDAGGRVRVRITGWTTHRFFTDELVWRMKFTPELAGIGEPQPGGWCLARRRWDGAASR